MCKRIHARAILYFRCFHMTEFKKTLKMRIKYTCYVPVKLSISKTGNQNES